MSLHDEPQTVREALALHEMLRRLGVQADDLHIVVSPLTTAVTVLISREEQEPIPIHVGQHDAADFAVRWPEAVARWNSNNTPDDERDQVFHRATIRTRAVEIVSILIQGGVYAGMVSR